MKTRIKLLISIFLISFVTNSRDASAQLFWDQASSFNGTIDSYISVKNSATLSITGSYTLEAWINPVNSTFPSLQYILQKRASGLNGFSMSLSNGKISLVTNNSTRLTGNTIIPSNTWTHVAGRYNASNGRFSIYINSVLDNSVDILSASPLSNTDSLLIGRGKGSAFPFYGMMDNLRIWNDVISPTQLTNIYRSIIATNTGKYSAIVLSLPFQSGNSSGMDFTIDDKTDYNQLTVNNGVTAYNLSNRPSVTTNYNECLELDGNTEYLSGSTNSVVSPVSNITLESWIYATDPFVSIRNVICKGTTSNPVSARYSLYLDHYTAGYFNIKAAINGNSAFSSDPVYLVDNWSHIAFTYVQPQGNMNFF